MKIVHLVAACLSVITLAACQPPAPSAEEQAEAAIEPAPVPEASPASAPPLPCGVLDQRNWTAELSAGAPQTLTVSGEIDLPTPGYSVSLARLEGASDGGAARLSLNLTPPSGVTTEVVTAHPVRYFAPAEAAYTSVAISCDGAPLTAISVAQ
ncbi:MAG: hypothetical protein AB7P07_02940 [Hyphomonadaceae bacterium]